MNYDKKFIQDKFIQLLGINDLMKKANNRYQVPCPVCGDSVKKNKKRLWINWVKDNYVCKCWNAGCPIEEGVSLQTFIKNYYPWLLEQYKLEIKESYLEDINPSSKPIIKITSNKLNYTKIPEGYEPLKFAKDELEYVKKRKVPQEIWEKWYFNNKYVLIPFYNKDRIYGYQTRHIKYKTFHIKTDNHKIWNFYNLNKNEPVYITESVFDACSVINAGFQAIAMLGSSIPDNFLGQLKDPIFLFDNYYIDKSAQSKIIQYTKKYSTLKFLEWCKNIKQKDINEVHIFYGTESLRNFLTYNIKIGFELNVKLKLFSNNFK